jgi:hypothetical protein
MLTRGDLHDVVTVTARWLVPRCAGRPGPGRLPEPEGEEARGNGDVQPPPRRTCRASMRSQSASWSMRCRPRSG